MKLVKKITAISILAMAFLVAAVIVPVGNSQASACGGCHRGYYRGCGYFRSFYSVCYRVTIPYCGGYYNWGNGWWW